MKKIQPLPFGVYFSVVFVLGLIGLGDSIYISISHYRIYTDIGYESFCAISRAINCDTVSQSPYSIVLGVPIPVWGILGYTLLMVLLINAWRLRAEKTYIWPTLFFLTLLYCANSVVLAVVSSYLIKSQCIMCILSHAANFGLLFYSHLIYNRFDGGNVFSGLRKDFGLYKRHWKKWSVTVVCMLSIAIGTMAFFPPYWKMGTHVNDQNLKTGMTEDGHPWIGAEKPELTIVEFTDYQCFQCKKMHFFLRQFVGEHADKIRLVHRHFPMDHKFNPIVTEPFHIGSGKLAMLSLYAAEKGKFWLINDMIFNMDFKTGAINIRNMAKTAGFDLMDFAASVNSLALYKKLEQDIQDGIDLGISATPTYLIKGETYLGQIPEQILSLH